FRARARAVAYRRREPDASSSTGRPAAGLRLLSRRMSLVEVCSCSRVPYPPIETITGGFFPPLRSRHLARRQRNALQIHSPEKTGEERPNERWLLTVSCCACKRWRCQCDHKDREKRDASHEPSKCQRKPAE